MLDAAGGVHKSLPCGLDLGGRQILVVAYEPIWAIGSGKAATPEDALEVCTLIREKIGKIFTPDIARKVRILYGGSVNEKNAASFNLSGIDGVLVGGASLKADTFAAIVRSF